LFKTKKFPLRNHTVPFFKKPYQKKGFAFYPTWFGRTLNTPKILALLMWFGKKRTFLRSFRFWVVRLIITCWYKFTGTRRQHRISFCGSPGFKPYLPICVYRKHPRVFNWWYIKKGSMPFCDFKHVFFNPYQSVFSIRASKTIRRGGPEYDHFFDATKRIKTKVNLIRFHLVLKKGVDT
jgi:hypothetical protein